MSQALEDEETGYSKYPCTGVSPAISVESKVGKLECCLRDDSGS